jgi:K+-sensing histidine kinase KdpD
VVQHFVLLVVKPHRMIEVTGTEERVLVNELEGLLELAVQNLLQNALKFSYPQTTVTINIGADRSIGIINQGDAVSYHMRGKFFGRYSRTDQKVSRPGLGLSIVKRFVDAHHGTIGVTRANYGGTEF